MEKLHEWMRANQWLSLLPVALVIGYQFLKWTIEDKRKRKAVIKARQETRNKFIAARHEKIEYFVDETISRPVNFGRKINWVAIRSKNHEAIVHELKRTGKKHFRTNLESGIHAAYASCLFVFPPFQDWILVLNPLYQFSEEERYEYLKELSKKYGEVQFFGSFRGVNYSSWMQFIQGETIRAYSVADGEIIKNEGALTDTEEAFIATAIREAIGSEEAEEISDEEKLLMISSEENVLKMAEKWSINPSQLEDMDLAGLGTIIEE